MCPKFLNVRTPRLVTLQDDNMLASGAPDSYKFIAVSPAGNPDTPRLHIRPRLTLSWYHPFAPPAEATRASPLQHLGGERMPLLL